MKASKNPQKPKPSNSEKEKDDLHKKQQRQSNSNQKDTKETKNINKDSKDQGENHEKISNTNQQKEDRTNKNDKTTKNKKEKNDDRQKPNKNEKQTQNNKNKQKEETEKTDKNKKTKKESNEKPQTKQDESREADKKTKTTEKRSNADLKKNDRKEKPESKQKTEEKTKKDRNDKDDNVKKDKNDVKTKNDDRKEKNENVKNRKKEKTDDRKDNDEDDPKNKKKEKTKDSKDNDEDNPKNKKKDKTEELKDNDEKLPENKQKEKTDDRKNNDERKQTNKQKEKTKDRKENDEDDPKNKKKEKTEDKNENDERKQTNKQKEKTKDRKDKNEKKSTSEQKEKTDERNDNDEKLPANKQKDKTKDRKNNDEDNPKNKKKEKTETKKDNDEKLPANKQKEKTEDRKENVKKSTSKQKEKNDDKKGNDEKLSANKQKEKAENRKNNEEKQKEKTKDRKDNDEKKSTSKQKDKKDDKQKNEKEIDKNDKSKEEKNKEKREKTPSTKSKDEQTNETKEDKIISERKDEIKKIGDIDIDQYNFLSNIFKTNPQDAIKKSEKYLKGEEFPTYESFIEEVKKTQKLNCCIYSWSKETLIAGCYDCQISENSCICIPCFLAGKHENHHTFLYYGSSGNCDCGDPKMWKKSGNCSHHKGPDSDPDVTQMIPKNRKKFITVFSSAFNGAFQSHDDTICSTIFNWISKFIQFGDGIRRCCSISICKLGSKFFFNELINLEKQSIDIFIDLLGKLVSDQLFSFRMGAMFLFNYLKLKKKMQEMVIRNNYDKKEKPFRPIRKFLDFGFHFFDVKSLLYLVKKNNFNWVDFFISSFQLIFDTLDKTDANFDKLNDGKFFEHIWYFKSLLEKLLKMDDQHENIQEFINRYCQLLIKYEAQFSFYFNIQNMEYLNLKDITYLVLIFQIYHFNTVFCLDNDTSEKNKNFSIDEIFSILVDFLKSDENLHVESIYISTENIAISPFIPVHHLFYCLLSSHSNSLDIISKSCKKKGIKIQDFCNLYSIYPLRLLACLFTPERFQNLSPYMFAIIEKYLTNCECSFNIFFGLFQTLLGIAPDKEIMLFNIAKTFGLFSNSHMELPEDYLLLDEFIYLFRQQEIIKETAHFDAAVFIMSVLTDRSIITFDKILFKRLRVIELLMISKPTSDEIETYVDDKINNPLFGDDLSSYAERVTTKDGSYFKLTNEDDFTPFFPLIFHIRRMKILSKYEDKLIPVLNYTNLPRGLDFKSCFRSNVFISLMFQCLLTENRLMETQVGLSMFILSMQNGPQFDEDSFNIKSPMKIEGETIENVIEKLTEFFKEKNDNYNYTTIQIKLNNQTKYESIIELVKSKQQLGYESIRKSNLPIQLENKETNDEEIQKQNKKKASELKDQIMKEFQAKQKQFTKGDPINNKENNSEDDENENVLNSETKLKNSKEKLQCSICQNFDSNDVIGFPCLSLHTIFPSLIDNKLHNKKVPLETNEKVFSFSICTHPVHFQCCKNLIDHHHDDDDDEELENNENNTFNCMIDRGKRNCLLPCFQEIEKSDDEIFSNKPSKNMVDAIDDFMIKAFRKKENIENPLIPLKSFIGVVSILEIRHRSRPECLDSSSISHLLRNLLLTLYFKYNSSEIMMQKKDPLLNLVIKIIKSEKPIFEFKKFVQEISKEIENDNDYLYEFLRRCAIIEDFSLKRNNQNDEFIDWDEILSFESLLKRFEISLKKLKTIELPLFETIQLADKFISLYLPPCNFDIFDSSFIKFVDLFTGQVVIFDPHDKINGQSPFPKLENYCKNVYNDGLAMFLCLTGSHASEIIISCFEIKKLFTKKGFYVDKFGDSDPGFTRGSILSLSPDRLENSVDKLLSGDIILY